MKKISSRISLIFVLLATLLCLGGFARIVQAGASTGGNTTGPYCVWDGSTLTFKYGEYTASDTVKALDMSQ